MKNLKTLYRLAANNAYNDGIDAGNEIQLVSWIRENCRYDKDKEFFLVLGIGSELADIQARSLGYKNEVDRAWDEVIKKPGNREKHEKWLRTHI